jgi:hypothetical protein
MPAFFFGGISMSHAPLNLNKLRDDAIITSGLVSGLELFLFPPSAMPR